MPCYEMRQEYKQAKAKGEEYIALLASNPFARAIETELAQKGIRVVSEVRMYEPDKLRVQVDMTIKNQWGETTRGREVVEIPIDELHDMAVKFLPPIDPTKPLTFSEMQKHFHPNAPAETNSPLPPMRRKFIEIPLIDGYAFQEVWEAIPPRKDDPPEETNPAKIREAIDLVNQEFQRFIDKNK